MQKLMRVMVFSVIMLTASIGLAQAPSSDQALLQSLLAEVHELRSRDSGDDSRLTKSADRALSAASPGNCGRPSNHSS